MEQYFGPIFDIYLNIHNYRRPEAQKDEIIADLMVWHLGDVLSKYLYMYGVS